MHFAIELIKNKKLMKIIKQINFENQNENRQREI